jgi:hypothetical protein
MRYLSLVSLFVSSSLFSMLSPVLQSVRRTSGAMPSFVSISATMQRRNLLNVVPFNDHFCDKDLFAAVHLGDPALVNHLLVCGANPHACGKLIKDSDDAGSVSVLDYALMKKNIAVAHALLHAGAYSREVKHIIQLPAQDLQGLLEFPKQRALFQGHSQVVRDLVVDVAGYDTDYFCFNHTLPFDTRVELLKKTMLLVEAGAQYNFILGERDLYKRGVFDVKPEDGYVLRISDLVGDWTRGVFPALARYLDQLITLNDKKRALFEREQAVEAIWSIMLQHDIDEKDVTIARKGPDSRLQEVE